MPKKASRYIALNTTTLTSLATCDINCFNVINDNTPLIFGFMGSCILTALVNNNVFVACNTCLAFASKYSNCSSECMCGLPMLYRLILLV